MRKQILLLILLSCLHIAARGQTIATLDDIDLSELPKATKAKALRYWYDDDGSSVRTVTQLKGKQSLDVSALIDGLHTLHYQVIDENNDVADVQSSLFMKMNGGIVGTTAKQLRYWFDDDSSTLKTITATNSTQTIDATKLIDGLHTVHYQVIGSDNAAYHIVSALFMKMGSGGSETVTAKKLMYWFDDETTISTVDITSGVQMLDASALMEGLHTIHYQVLCSNGALTPAQSSLFMRMSFDTDGTVAKKLRYWFDDAQTATETNIMSGSTMLDASALVDGLHTVHYQIVDSKGSLGAPASSVFMKMDAAASTQSKKLRYWFDDDAASVRVVDVAQGTQTLDVSDLLTGLHTICYQLIDSEGKVGTPYTRIFMKTFDKVVADGQNRVTKYQYWLNKNSQAMQTVELANAANPYQFISLLPMQKEPIHSDCFHFEITNGVPTVYAKNIFHIRFHDVGGYFADGEKPFVDYDVKQEVNDIIPLQPNSSKTFSRVAEDNIKWFSFEADPGDSVAFRSSQATTLQIFSPLGKEIYSTSGSESVKYSGCHVFERGTFYVALHDVTGSQQNITLDYFHLGKYAVLSHSPEEVGVMVGNFYVRLFGNGYDKLTKAKLVDGTNELPAEIIQVQDISNAMLQFSFANENQPRGKYDLVLEFADGNEKESMSVVDAVTIADPIISDIDVDVISHHTTAKPYPVTVRVKNTGTVTYQFIPLFFANSINRLESLHLLNLGMQSNKNVMDAGIKTFYKVNNLFGEDSCIVVPTIMPLLNPYQEVDYYIGFVSAPHAHFNMYAWTETPWSMRDTNIQNVRRNGPRKATVTNVTCEMDPCELASYIPNASCVCNILWGNVSAIVNAHGAVNQWRNNQLRNDLREAYEYNGLDWPYADIPVKSPADIFDQVVRECLGELAPENISRLQDAIEDLMDQMRDRDQDECPPPPPHPVDPYMPGDPNDIIGYTAESGSKYMKKGTSDVYYTIEFENDPEIANAAAHTIVVTDTLDTKRFDLSTFAAKSVMLGGKVMTLDGEKRFSKRTMDLRPEINVIAQVSLSLDEQKGIAKWTIESLDPMTMEPTLDAMQGVLPVNVNGNGQGEVFFDIKLKPGMVDGASVSNRAGIVFDQEGTIMTPIWTNIVDGTLPTSRVVDAELLPGGETAAISIDASDEASGPWRYNVYVQYGSGAWFLAADNVPADTTATVKIYDGIVHHFYCVVTDMAGNVEEKEARSEFTFTVSEHLHGDANSDGTVDVADIAEVIDVMAKGEYRLHDDTNNDGVVDVADIAEIIDIMAAMARAAATALE